MDDVFKSLSDETRRGLLDRLRERDGQTLTELESAIGMTRFGVMKHLKVLESANLVVTRKLGRFKYHYLNAAPLQLIVDRWITPITQQAATRALLDLKADLERKAS
jgi:DNA-binding transcriptional ArsR family regulator